MTGYNPSEISELLERMDRQEKRDLLEQEVAKRLAKESPRETVEIHRPPELKRSTMTAADKSRYIREHGKPKYDALPW